MAQERSDPREVPDHGTGDLTPGRTNLASTSEGPAAEDRPPLPDTQPVPAQDWPDTPGQTTAEEEPFDPGRIGGKPEPGQILFGRYQVERRIGEGGMGSVWLVHHLGLDALRALKLIVTEHAFHPEVQARFLREARVMARLSHHPNAVTVHDAGIAGGAAFIEMEYVRGPSLNRLLRPGVPMPLGWTARILVQLCAVLQEAHDHQIVHRDLKPSNLMLVEGRPPGQERLKVLDFGIAKVLGPGQEGGPHTEFGVFLGTRALKVERWVW